MTRTERIIAVVSGVATLGNTVWWIVSVLRSRPIPSWLYLVSVLAAAILGFCLGRYQRLLRKQTSLRELGTLSFDYLPDSPVNHGWNLQVDSPNGSPPSFSMDTDAPLPGALRVVHTHKYYMDYGVEQALGLGNMAEFFIRFAQASALYLRVALSTRDGSQQSEGWLRYKPGEALPRKARGGEWSVPIPGDLMDEGWIDARISIADDVARTYGRKGWLYAGLKRIRLRGSLSVTPIKFLRIAAPDNEVEALHSQH